VNGGPNPIFGVTALNPQTALAGSTTSAGTTKGVGNLLVVDISNPAAMSTVAQVQCGNGGPLQAAGSGQRGDCRG